MQMLSQHLHHALHQINTQPANYYYKPCPVNYLWKTDYKVNFLQIDWNYINIFVYNMRKTEKISTYIVPNGQMSFDKIQTM